MFRRNGYDVFISYSRTSGAHLAQVFRTALERHGIRAFLDVNAEYWGSFRDELAERIGQTPHMLVLLTPGCTKSLWMPHELELAFRTGRNVLVVREHNFDESEHDSGSEIWSRCLTLNSRSYLHEFSDEVVRQVADAIRPRRWIRIALSLSIGLTLAGGIHFAGSPERPSVLDAPEHPAPAAPSRTPQVEWSKERLLRPHARSGSIKTDPRDADAVLAKKLELYINCINETSVDVARSRSRYLSWVDEAAGVSGSESLVRGIDDLSRVESTIRDLDLASAAAPSLPEIEARAQQYRDALSELAPIVSEAHRYYDQADYKDDAFKRGKQLHAPLIAAFAKFAQADSALEADVMVLNSAVAERLLSRDEHDRARKLLYLVDRAVLSATQLAERAYVATLDELDDEALQAKLTAFEHDLRELETYTEASNDTRWLRYRLQGFLKAVKELKRRKHDGRDFNREHISGSAEYISGHPAQVAAKYNEAIREANSMHYSD